MKKALCIILAVVMLMGVLNVGVFAADIETPTVTASNAVSGGINVYWTAVEGAVKYNVYRRIGGSSSWILVGSTDGKTNLIDPGVEGGKFYIYSVRAYEESGEYSVFDTTKAYTVKCVELPRLTKLVNTTNGLQVTWNAVAGANNYRVYRRGAGSTSWLYLGTTTSTTFTDGKASSGAYWRYTVRAVGNGYYSGFDTNGLYTIRLANPYSIKASVGTDGVNVSWAKINGATGYRVYRRGAAQSYWTYLGATTGNTFVDKNVTVNQYYRYTVRATRGSVYSDFYTAGSVVQFKRDIKKELPIIFSFESPYIDWMTAIQINPDFTYEAEYIGVKNEYTLRLGAASGKMTNVKQLTAYAYSMTCSSMDYQFGVGDKTSEDGYLFEGAKIDGLAKNNTLYLYVPGTPVENLPNYYIDELYYLYTGDRLYTSTNAVTDCYILYNASQQTAFFAFP